MNLALEAKDEQLIDGDEKKKIEEEIWDVVFKEVAEFDIPSLKDERQLWDKMYSEEEGNKALKEKPDINSVEQVIRSALSG